MLTAVGQLLLDYALQLRDDVGPSVFFSDTRRAVKSEDDEPSRSTSSKQEATASLADPTLVAASDAEEVAQLTEADMMECHRRLQRLQRIRRLLQTAVEPSASSTAKEKDQESSPSSIVRHSKENEVQNYGETIRRNPVLTTMLRGLERMKQQLEGSSIATAPSGALTTAAGAPHPIQPLLLPVSLADGALSAFSRNVGIVFRRRPTGGGGTAGGTPVAVQPVPSSQSRSSAGKRTRDGDEASTPPVNHWAMLAMQQRKSRFALYTLRTALLPHVHRVCAPFYTSPAVRALAQLNAAAERFMLERVWCVHTKAHLLREAPSVARDVEESREALRESLKTLSSAQENAYVRDVSYVQFVCTDSGVLRVCIQHALFVDLTYDLRRRQWMVLGLHWNLHTTAAAASLTSSAVLNDMVSVTVPLTTLSSPGASCLLAPYQQLQPENNEALVAFLQTAFLQSGLSGGLRAANRLLCALVMDALALQLLHLQQTFFTGDALGRLVDVEVRPGTFVSVHLSLSEVMSAHAVTASTVSDVVHIKIGVRGGTVVMERVCGTSLSTRRVTLLLGTSSLIPPPDPASDPLPLIVLDMEALLWQSVSAGS
jgi:hypothetical protein